MRHPITTITIALILCTTLLASGCSAEARKRNQLRKDPMASATWDGLELLGTEESREGGWKPPQPSLTRCFHMTIPRDEAFDKILTTAKQHKWTEVDIPNPGEARWASKVTSKGATNLYISASITACEQYPETNLLVTIS